MHWRKHDSGTPKAKKEKKGLRLDSNDSGFIRAGVNWAM